MGNSGKNDSQLAVRETKTRHDPVRGKQSDPVRNEQTMEVLREEKQLHFCPWMNKQQEGRENWKCVSLQHSHGEENGISSVSEEYVRASCWWSVRVGED